MDLTLTFTVEEVKNLNAALANRPQFSTLEEFLRAHCQGAIDAGLQERRAAAVEALMKDPTAKLPEIIRVEVPVEVVPQ